LPVNTLEERWKVFCRLLLFLVGKHGAITQIHNGEINKTKFRSKTNSPGILKLDAASAAVLKRRNQFTRTVGPGLVFTDQNERITGVVDLRTQRKSLGPLPSEDPFESQKKNETNASYKARLKRRHETGALTQDGIEIVPSITVIYRIASNLDQVNSFFGFSPISVRKAVTNQIINHEITGVGNSNNYDWRLLPGYLVVSLWKDYVVKYTIDELFPKSNTSKSTLEIIEKSINAVLSTHHYKENTTSDNSHVNKETSREYKLLLEYGLHFIEMKINHVWIPQEIEAQIASNWHSTWNISEENKNSILAMRKNLTEETGKIIALKMLVDNFSAYSDTNALASNKEKATWLFKIINRLKLGDKQIEKHLINEITNLKKLYSRLNIFLS